MPSILLSDLPHVSRLALSYAPASVRTEHGTLLALDARFSGILRQKREPLLAQMRLAWWRDMFGTPASSWPRGDPLVEALSEWEQPADLVHLVDGWEVLLEEFFTSATAARFADGRALAFTALARQLNLPGVADQVAEAARLWALADLAANMADKEEREIVLELAREVPPPRLLSRKLRPLAVLAGLGESAVKRGGGSALLVGPTSLLRALRIGVVGG